jgi:hypothetical protein
MIMEENKYKQVFDMYIMLLVFYIAIVVPYRLAFSLEESKATKTISYVIDFSFFIDIILTFFTAYFDEPNCIMVENYKDIALNYLKGWFIFDVLSIFPFELCISNKSGGSSQLSSINSSIRIARIGKIYKMIRFVRLAKIAKAFKKRRSASAMHYRMRINAGLQRVGFFAGTMVVLLHVFTSGWIMLA